MKKLICVAMAMVLFVTVSVCPVGAAKATDSANIAVGETVEWTETLPDGLVLVYTVTQHKPTSGAETAATTKTVSGTGTVSVKDGSTVLYTLSVNATFSVNVGSSATCTGCSYTYSIKNSSWNFDSATATKSGNTATATGNFYKKVLFVTVDRLTTTVQLRCDVNGNLTTIV